MGRATTDLPDPLEQTTARSALGQPLSDGDVPADDLISQMAGEQIDRLLAEAGADSAPETANAANGAAQSDLDELAAVYSAEEPKTPPQPGNGAASDADVAAFISAVEPALTPPSEPIEAADSAAPLPPRPPRRQREGVRVEEPVDANAATDAAGVIEVSPADDASKPIASAPPEPIAESPAAATVVAAEAPIGSESEPSVVEPPVSAIESPPPHPPIVQDAKAEEFAPVADMTDLPQGEPPSVTDVAAQAELSETDHPAPTAEPSANPAPGSDSPEPTTVAIVDASAQSAPAPVSSQSPAPTIAAAGPIDPSPATASAERQALKLDLDINNLPPAVPKRKSPTPASSVPANLNRWLVTALKTVNSPAESLPDGLREAIGKIALVTTFNAVAVLIYVLLFRRHH